MGAYSRGLKTLPGIGLIPIETFLLINHFSDATRTTNRVFFKGHANSRQLMGAFSFLAL